MALFHVVRQSEELREKEVPEKVLNVLRNRVVQIVVEFSCSLISTEKYLCIWVNVDSRSCFQLVDKWFLSRRREVVGAK